MTRQAINLIGSKFGHWTILAREGSSPTTLQARWRGRCRCGSEAVKDAGAWKASTENSACPTCGKAITAERARRHGLTDTPIHTAWMNMRRRCRPSHPRYEDWGGRGIRVHPAWDESFETFHRYVIRYLGERPTPRHSLDRRNNDKGYVPGNLRWATPQEQAQNKRRYRPRGV